MKTNNIRRSKPERDFTVIPNEPLQDDSLSWGARGLLSFLLSMPVTWEVNVKDLAKRSKKNGRDATQNFLTELIEASFVVREQVRLKGRFLGYNYIVYDLKQPNTEKPDTVNQETDAPNTENPDTEKPDTRKPYTENPQQERTHRERTQSNKKTQKENLSDSLESDAPSIGFEKNDKPLSGQMMDVWAEKYTKEIGEEPRPKRPQKDWVAVAEFAKSIAPKLKAGETPLEKWISFLDKAWGLDDNWVIAHFEPSALWSMYDQINAALFAKRKGGSPTPIKRDSNGPAKTSGIRKPFKQC
jgi:hypothetical protein